MEKDIKFLVTNRVDRLLETYPHLEPFFFKIVSESIVVLSYIEKLFNNDREFSEYVMSMLDELIEKFIPENTVTCRKGCSHCCNMNVSITSQIEIPLIREALKTTEVDWDMVEKQSHLNNPITYIDYTDIRTCVFLKNNICSIYDKRPIMCRLYFSADPVEHCINFQTTSNPVAVPIEGLVTAITTSKPIDDLELNLPKLLVRLKNENEQNQ